jgi:probable HAF family extracellular repeat protein
MHVRGSVVHHALVAMCALTLIAVGNAAEEYRPVQLDSPGHAFAFGLNNRGQVVGRASLSSGETHAVLWDQGQLIDLGTLPGGTYSEAYAINDAGQVVGWSMTDQSTCTAFDGCWHAFLWENGTMIDLGGLDPRFQSYAYSINGRGQISGTSATADYPFGYFRAVTWLQGELLDLGLPDSATDAFALGINAAGTAVGAANIDGRSVPILWSQAAISRLPMPPGESGEARKINDKGLIVGRGANRGLLWTNGELTLLPNPIGAARSDAYDINNAGVIVGDSLTTTAGMRAVRWAQGSVNALPLGPGWTESFARGINARGDVAGAAHTATILRAVVWLK